MLKKLLLAVLALFAAAAFAAVDVNKADQAALETVKGIGPSISAKIIEERKKSPFKDWSDLVERVKGIGEGSAAKFSAEGLTVNGAAFAGASAKPAASDAKKEDKKEKKAEKKEEKKDKSDKAAVTEGKASAPKAADAQASAPKATGKK
jgi:competence protein ComEA